MRTGLWIPISSNALGVAFIIAFIWIIIYAFYYNVRKGSINKLENKFNIEKGIDDSSLSNILRRLNVPESAEKYFKNRNIDFSNNTLTYFTDGPVAFALGSHKGLRVPKVLFRIDYSNNPVVHKLHVIGDNNESIAELHLTAESTIFTERGIKYYEVSWKDLRILSDTDTIQFRIHDSKVNISKEETNQIIKAIQFSLNLKSNDPHSLLARND